MAEIIASTYKIIDKIGTGGGGIIYLAYHTRLKKRVILKADKRKITTRPELLRREVDVLKELNHTYIPQVYDYFIEDDMVYTVIDYIEGESLDKPLKRGKKFSQVQVILWARQILEALDYLHSPVHGSPARGYVHSDIKPANIMRKPDNNICLIDFNIALALGDENAIGRSRGYASPEHYGLDFSSNSSIPQQEGGSSGTEILPEALDKRNNRSGISSSGSGGSGSYSRKKVVPDVRSDIYSLGATLYHLLSGRRPAQNAKEVAPLSKKEFNPQIVEIITKAMNPNPDLRYQTAKEMLESLRSLKKNDRRMLRWKRRNRTAYVILLVFLAAGILTSFAGLKRMQTEERWLRLTEDSQNFLQEGNRVRALENLMQVYESKKGLLVPEPPPRTQEVLTEALGVYDLADTFQKYKTVELPSAPLNLRLSPEGKTAACICSGKLVLLDLDSAEIISMLPAEKSALAEAEYLNETTVVYAGEDGITVYDIAEEKELWKGEKATGIAVSGDGGTVAAVYRDETHAVIYNALTGEHIQKIDFGKKKQNVQANDIFVNPSDNLFCLNGDGTLLAVSFEDGSLEVIDLESENGNVEIFDSTAGYSHYEGEFYEKYLAFSATDYDLKESVFAVIDLESVSQTGGFGSEGYYFTSADQDGIVVGVDNILVAIDPETGEQTALVDTPEHIESYSRGGGFTAVSSEGKTVIYDEQTNEICALERDVSCDLLAINRDTAVIGSLNSPVLWIMKYERHPESQTAVYDPEYSHDEARLSADGKTIMLFSYDKFRICDLDGTVIRDVSIPDAEEVYDQQFRRKGAESYLEVTYRDGSVDKYDASDGRLLGQEEGKPPDLTLDEVFETDHLRIESPLHGTPAVYDKKTGRLICELEEDAYLTYITETGDYIVAQYVTTDNQFYGYLMDENCQVLAYLPNVCDVLEDKLLFDYPSGSIREAKIYELDELLQTARSRLEEEKSNEKN